MIVLWVVEVLSKESGEWQIVFMTPRKEAADREADERRAVAMDREWRVRQITWTHEREGQKPEQPPNRPRMPRPAPKPKPTPKPKRKREE